MKAAPALALMLCASPAWAQEEPVIKMVVPLPKELPDQGAVVPVDVPKVCRPPQPQSNTRRMGPAVCLPQAQWDELHAKGLDISPDGRRTLQSEKYRSLNVCNTTSC
jgi:hypothetical protein